LQNLVDSSYGREEREGVKRKRKIHVKERGKKKKKGKKRGRRRLRLLAKRLILILKSIPRLNKKKEKEEGRERPGKDQTWPSSSTTGACLTGPTEEEGRGSHQRKGREKKNREREGGESFLPDSKAKKGGESI